MWRTASANRDSGCRHLARACDNHEPALASNRCPRSPLGPAKDPRRSWGWAPAKEPPSPIATLWALPSAPSWRTRRAWNVGTTPWIELHLALEGPKDGERLTDRAR